MEYKIYVKIDSADPPDIAAGPAKLVEYIKSSIINFQNIKLSDDIFNIRGMSGVGTRIFYNKLIEAMGAQAVLLEIGCWRGSTTCSFLYKNKLSHMVCIDNWSGEFEGNLNPREDFFNNLNKFKGDNVVTVLEQDCFKIDRSALSDLLSKKLFNVYLYDGNHDEADHYNSLVYYYDILAAAFIFIVDDWNYLSVRTGTYTAIKELNLTVLYSHDIRTTPDDTHPVDYHPMWNGICVFVLGKAPGGRPAPVSPVNNK